MTSPSRRQRAIDRIREDILEAAARAFTKHGYRSATMRAIAREAGYTAAALYTYFKSKDEILEALSLFLHTQLLGRFDEPLPPGLTFPQKLALLVHRHLASAEQYRDLYALIVTIHPPAALGRSPNRNRKGNVPQRSPFWILDEQIARLAKWLSENAAEGDLGPHSPEVAARFLVSIGHGFLWEWVSGGPHALTREKLAETILDLFFHGIQGHKNSQGGMHP